MFEKLKTLALRLLHIFTRFPQDLQRPAGLDHITQIRKSISSKLELKT